MPHPVGSRSVRSHNNQPGFSQNHPPPEPPRLHTRGLRLFSMRFHTISLSVSPVGMHRTHPMLVYLTRIALRKLNLRNLSSCWSSISISHLSRARRLASRVSRVDKRQGDSAQQLQLHDGLRSAKIAYPAYRLFTSRLSLIDTLLAHRASCFVCPSAALSTATAICHMRVIFLALVDMQLHEQV